MARAGQAYGFEVSLDYTSATPFVDIAQAIQANLARINIRLRMNPDDSRQVVSHARQHDIALVQQGSDYFAPNTDNGGEARNRTLAWRASRLIPELSARALTARRGRHVAAQRDARGAATRQPLVMLLQLIENIITRAGVSGLDTGPMSDRYRYRYRRIAKI